MKKLIIILFALIGLQACSSGPEPIRYGQESCSYCKMGISDKRFGAEIITRKGKVIKFDAAECMLDYVKSGYLAKNEIASYYVVDATQPGQLVNAEQAFYVNSEQVRSPMGGNIAASISKEGTRKLTAEFSGNILDWGKVLEKFGI
jgi:copper chaperone NosL